jgi:hypothetical protein
MEHLIASGAIVRALRDRFLGLGRSKDANRRLEMPEINPVDWNVEEFRRLLDEPFKMIGGASPDDMLDQVPDDRQRILIATDEFTTKECLRPVELCEEPPGATEKDPNCGRSISETQLATEIGQASVTKSISHQLDPDSPVNDAKAVLVLSIEMASRLETDAVMEQTDSTPGEIASTRIVEAEVALEERQKQAELSDRSLRADVQYDATLQYADEPRSFVDEVSGAPVSDARPITGRDSQLSQSADDTSFLAMGSDGSLASLEQEPSLENESSNQSSDGTQLRLPADPGSGKELALLKADQVPAAAVSDMNVGGTAWIARGGATTEELTLSASDPADLSGADPAPGEASLARPGDATAECTVPTFGASALPPAGAVIDDSPVSEPDDAGAQVSPPIGGHPNPSQCSASVLAGPLAQETNVDEGQATFSGSEANSAAEKQFSPAAYAEIEVRLPDVRSGERLQPTSSFTSLERRAPAPIVERAIETDASEPQPNRSGQTPVQLSAGSLRGLGDKRGAPIPSTGRKLALLKAVVEPDLRTAPVDRERAIALRWALRDIRGNRLGILPVDPVTLQTLVDLSLIEISDGKPTLTSSGFNVIAST